MAESAAITLISGSAHPALAAAIAAGLGQPLLPSGGERFPDGELSIQLAASVRDRDVCVVQPTSPPVDEHLLELAFLLDACRRGGAARLTAVMPYFGYARHDRRVRGGEPLGARVAAGVIELGRPQRVIGVDVHSATVESCFEAPFEHLTAVPLLAAAAARLCGPDTVVVAPDLGAVKLAERYAALLRYPVAVVVKTRLSGAEVRAGAVVGDVRGRTPLVVDDMISTGGTVVAALAAVMAAGALRVAHVVVSHALLVGAAAARLTEAGVGVLIATDSVPGEHPGLRVERVSLAPLLVEHLTGRRAAPPP